MGGVKTEEKKQHFDDIYVAPNPVPYKERILDELQYVSDDFNRATFDRLVLPWATECGKTKQINFCDLCGCFGNTTMATLYGMSYDAIRNNWSNDDKCKTISGQRRFDSRTTAIDISEPAMAYGKTVGLYDDAIVSDLNAPGPDAKAKLTKAVSEADILICTAALVYLDPDTIEYLLDAFCSNETEGYVLVNFLNPFALEKADETKRLLLNKLDFVGSTASRHRKLSPLERGNYPDEEWSLLEIWVLKRRAQVED